MVGDGEQATAHVPHDEEAERGGGGEAKINAETCGADFVHREGSEPCSMTARWAIFGALILCVSLSPEIIVLPEAKIRYFGNATLATEYSSYIDASSNFLGVLTAPVLGRLSDTLGRKPLFIFACMVITAPSVCLLLSPVNLLPYLVCTVMRGFAGGPNGIFPLITAYLADLYPAEQRSKYFGWSFAIFSVGFILSPLITLFDRGASNETIFKVSVGFNVTSVLLACFLPESLARPNRVPMKGGWRHVLPFRALNKLFHCKVTLVLASISFFFTVCENGIETTIFYFLNDKLGFMEKDNARLFLILGISSLFVQSIALPVLLKFVSDSSVLRIGLVSYIFHLLFFAWATVKWMVYANMLLAGFTFLTFPAINGLMSSVLSGKDQGVGFGTLASVRGIAAAVGPLMFGSVYAVLGSDQVRSPEGVFYFGCSFVLLALLLSCCWLPGALLPPASDEACERTAPLLLHLESSLVCEDEVEG